MQKLSLVVFDMAGTTIEDLSAEGVTRARRDVALFRRWLARERFPLLPPNRRYGLSPISVSKN